MLFFINQLIAIAAATSPIEWPLSSSIRWAMHCKKFIYYLCLCLLLLLVVLVVTSQHN